MRKYPVKLIVSRCYTCCYLFTKFINFMFFDCLLQLHMFIYKCEWKASILVFGHLSVYWNQQQKKKRMLNHCYRSTHSIRFSIHCWRCACSAASTKQNGKKAPSTTTAIISSPLPPPIHSYARWKTAKPQ